MTNNPFFSIKLEEDQVRLNFEGSYAQLAALIATVMEDNLTIRPIIAYGVYLYARALDSTRRAEFFAIMEGGGKCG